jgi:ferredoxin-NADP reductase
VHPLRRRALQAARALTNPLLPDDYLELINPLWSTRELRGRVERICRETDDAVTVLVKPGFAWEGHRPGQYLRIGLDIDGRRHWRAYSLTSDPGRPDGMISVTPKLVPDGVVSPHIVGRLRPGDLVVLGGVEGTFVLPDPTPRKLLFITAGSGITPVVAMLRALDRRGELHDTVHHHSERKPGGVVFGTTLERLRDRHDGYRLTVRTTSQEGRMAPADHLDELCPDWRERETFICGPTGLLDAVSAHFEAAGVADRLHLERFAPAPGAGDGERGEGGTITFARSGTEAANDGQVGILDSGEDAGLTLPYGCRMGICHTCIGRLCAGEVRDLRTGEVHGAEGEMVRTCINAPEGAITIDL